MAYICCPTVWKRLVCVLITGLQIKDEIHTHKTVAKTDTPASAGVSVGGIRLIAPN
jgi:hypothetical protein